MAGRGRPRIIRVEPSGSGTEGSDSDAIGDSISPSDIDRQLDGIGSGDGGSGNTDSGSDDNGTPRRKRQYTKRGDKTPQKVDLSSLAGLLMGFHALAAIKVPEMALDQAEAKQLQERLEAVARWYPISATQKAIDHAALIGAVGWIYAPRVFAINRRMRQERANSPRPQPQPQPRPNQPAAAPTASTIRLPSEYGSSVIGDDVIH